MKFEVGMRVRILKDATQSQTVRTEQAVTRAALLLVLASCGGSVAADPCVPPSPAAHDWVHAPGCSATPSGVSCPQPDGTAWDRLEPDGTIVHWRGDDGGVVVLCRIEGDTK